MPKCVFCKRIADGEYDDRYADYVTFGPLNPVTKGHMLIVPVGHATSLSECDSLTMLGWALRYFTNDLDEYNIITSKGANATQTIQHLHFHIVPRRPDDGLLLPWTNQHTASPQQPKPLEEK